MKLSLVVVLVAAGLAVASPAIQAREPKNKHTTHTTTKTTAKTRTKTSTKTTCTSKTTVKTTATTTTTPSTTTTTTATQAPAPTCDANDNPQPTINEGCSNGINCAATYNPCIVVASDDECRQQCNAIACYAYDYRDQNGDCYVYPYCCNS